VEVIKLLETFDTLEDATAHLRREGWQYAVVHNGEIVWTSADTSGQTPGRLMS